MKTSIFSIIQRAFRSAPAVHPVENGMARRWIKQRLIAVFPELRNNPAALERAYQTLSLEPRPGRALAPRVAYDEVRFEVPLKRVA